MRKLAVLGKPIDHSKSPLIHSTAYEILKLDWSYGRIECDIGDFAETISSFDNKWLGLSLTMPLKETAYEFALSTDKWAQESKAVNTLLHRGNGWHGYNTDIPGLINALKEQQIDVTNSVVLGTGSTAQSAVLALRELAAETITVAGRRKEAATTIAKKFATEKTSITAHTLSSLTNLHNEYSKNVTAVISTIPGHATKNLALPEFLFNSHLFDVAYDPWPSYLTTIWEKNGGKASSGIGMLVHQALYQIRIFYHGSPDDPLPNEPVLLQAMKKACDFGL